MYYQLWFAINILSTKKDSLLPDYLVKEILDTSMSGKSTKDVDEVMSGVIKMVVPY